MKQCHAVIFFALLASLTLAAGCSDDTSTNPDKSGGVSSLSYKGHENDSDSNRLVGAYPSVVGTRLDDCQTCHTDGEVTYGGGNSSRLNPCSYCHLIPYPDASVVSGAPGDYENTLTPYGLDYKSAGRSAEALRAIENLDSDGDSHSNAAEIAELRYPGDPDSKPGQPIVPVHTFTRGEIAALATHDQFLLMNSHKQQFDTYATYVGVEVKDLLAAGGVDLSQATGVTFIAPDGYAKDVDLETINQQFPAGVYYANLDPGSFSDPGQGFVTYPREDQLPEGLVDGGIIPGEQWLMVACRRDGLELDEGHLDPVSGKLEGEGPFRLIVPQSTPGAPDRGSKYSPSGYDGHDCDSEKDHNAGLCIRALVAVRINPMPEGYEEFDWKNGGWSMVEKGQLIIYGTGVTGD